MAIPGDVRRLLDAPSYVHLSTPRADGSPRNWVVWVGLEDDCILVCTSDAIWKAKDMRRDPRGRPVGHRPGEPVPHGHDPGTPGRGLPVPGPDLGQVHRRAVPQPLTRSGSAS